MQPLPDLSSAERRSYTKRLVSHGMDAGGDRLAVGPSMGDAVNLVDRVIGEAIRPYHQLMGAFLALGAAFGLALGVVIGLGVAWGVWQ